MATETQIGQLVIDLKVKTEALEKGLETARKKLQEIEQNNKQVENSNKSLDASYLAMSTTAVLALNKIVGAIKECVNEYNSYTQAMSSLQNVSEYTGESMQDLSEIMNKFSAYMTKADLATTIKNFSLMGFTAEQTEQMIEALTNSAIRNRNANYTVSEAVRVASEGYRQGLSTLSDSAGVTENLSVMLDNYAKSIGKTASQLTETEKNQAYLNRTMYAAEPFASAMSDYLETLAGKQGEYSQAMRETQTAYAEALEPMMKSMLEGGTGILNFINQLIEINPAMVSGTTTFAISLTSLILIMKALIVAKDSYTKSTLAATIATKGFTATLMTNPVFLMATAIGALVTVINGVTNAYNELSNKLNQTSEIQERYNQILNNTLALTNENIEKVEEDKKILEQRLELLKEELAIKEQLQNVQSKTVSRKDTSNLKNIQLGMDKLNLSIRATNVQLKEYDKYLTKANIDKALDTETTKNMQKEAATLKVNVQQMQEYLNIIKKGETSTEEYSNAVKELTKKYPEAVNAQGIMIDVAQDFINSEQQKADASWTTSQETIQGYISVINAGIELAESAKGNERKQAQVAKTIGMEYSKIIPTLTSVLNILQIMEGHEATEVPGTQQITTYTPKKTTSSSTSVYSNKALDNYKKQIEHKKALDQISTNQEVSMWEYALRKYAKTADERNEIREKIYELNKELAQKEKDLLDQQTEDYENYIQDQKNARGSAYDITEQTSDYNKIIQMHRNYLNQIMKDERLSLEERKEIYREELQTIRDYEQQKRDLRVEQIDNTVSQLTSAITKQLEEMQEKDIEFIEKQIEEVEKLKEIRINAINEEYDAKIEAIEKELEALDKAEQQKTRDEEDAEYEKKKKRLEELVAFEHDATTKANYQKELDKLIAEYQKNLDERALEDKKEALNAQKDLLQQEQDDKTQVIEEETEKQKELYNKQLENLEEYYDEQLEKAQETAEKMLLNVEQNQDKILSLLKNYGDAYEITGQSLGEKLAQGINEGISNKIENIIQKIQDTIDLGIENKIKEWTSEMYSYETGSNKPQTKTINVYQTNNIKQNPEMPSETYRKLRNIDEQLASSLAGM